MILLSFIIVTILWIIDLKNFQRHASPSFTVSSLTIDGRNQGPEATFQVGLKYSSSSDDVTTTTSLKYSSFEIQSITCNIPSGQIDFDFETIPTPPAPGPSSQHSSPTTSAAAALEEDDQYEVTLSCPDEDIDDHASMIWETLVGRVDSTTASTSPYGNDYHTINSSEDSSFDLSNIFEDGICSISIRVHVGHIIPIDYTYDLQLNDVMELFSSNQDEEIQTSNMPNLPTMDPFLGSIDDVKVNLTDYFNYTVDDVSEETENTVDDIDPPIQDTSRDRHSFPTMEWIHLDRLNVDEMTVGLCATGLENFMESVGLQSAVIHLPSVTMTALPSFTYGTIKVPSFTHRMTLEMEELEVSLPQRGQFTVSLPQGGQFTAGHSSDRVCAYFTIRSIGDDVPFYRPVMDLVVSDEQIDTIEIDIDGSGSFLETMLGKTHALIFTKSIRSEDDGLIPVRGRNLRLQDEVKIFQDAYNAALAECLNIEDNTGAFSVGLCSSIDIHRQTISLLGSLDFYDFGVAGVSNTSWVVFSTNEGDASDKIEIETNALMVLTDESSVMNVTGVFILDVTDSESSDRIAALDASLINDGPLWPFEGILDMDFLQAGDIFKAAVNEITFHFEGDGLDKMTGDFTLDTANPDLLIMRGNLVDVLSLHQIEANAQLQIFEDGEFSLNADSKCAWDRTDKWDMTMATSNILQIGNKQTISMNVDEIVSGFKGEGLTTIDGENLKIDSNTKFSVYNFDSDFIVRGSIETDGDTDLKMSGSSSMTWNGENIFDLYGSCLYDTPFDFVIIEGDVLESGRNFLVTADVEYNKKVDTLSATLTHGLFKDDILTIKGEIVDDSVADFEMNGQSSCIWHDRMVWDGNLSVSFYDYFETDDTASLEARLIEQENDLSMQTKIKVDDAPGEFGLILQSLIVDIKGEPEVDSQGMFRLNKDDKSIDLDLQNGAGYDFIANMTFEWSPDFGRIKNSRVTSYDGSNIYLQVEKAEVLASDEGLWDASSLSLALLMPYRSGSLNGVASYAWDSDEENFSCGMSNVVMVWEDDTYLNLNTATILDLDDTSFSFTVEETSNLGTVGNITLSMQLDDLENDYTIRVEKMFLWSSSRTVFDSTGLLKIVSTDKVVDISISCDSGSTATLQMGMECDMSWDGNTEKFSTRLDRMLMGWDRKIFVEMPIDVFSFEDDVEALPTPVDTQSPQSPTNAADPNVTTSPQTQQPSTLVVSTSEPVGTDSILLEGVDFFLAGVEYLSQREIVSFEEITQEFLGRFHSSSTTTPSNGIRSLRSNDFSDTETNVTVVDQQIDGTGNTVTTNVVFMFEREINITESDSLHLIEAPFRNETTTQDYVDTLHNLGEEGLSAVTSVSVDTSNTVVIFDEDIESNDPSGDENSPEGGLTTGSLVGIVVGSVVVFVVCFMTVVWYILKRRRNETESNNDGTQSYSLPTIKESKRFMPGHSDSDDDDSSISSGDGDEESDSTFDEDEDLDVDEDEDEDEDEDDDEMDDEEDDQSKEDDQS